MTALRVFPNSSGGVVVGMDASGCSVSEASLAIRLSVAVIVTSCWVETRGVTHVIVARSLPRRIVTGAGAGTAAGVVEKVTGMSPGPARHSRATVTVTGLPPITVEGLRVSDLTPTGRSVRSAPAVAPSRVAAVSLTGVTAATACANPSRRVNEPLVAPAGIDRGGGEGIRLWLLLVRVIGTPPDGAGVLSVTVPVTGRQ